MEPLRQTKQDPLFLSWKNVCVDFMKAYQEQNVDKMLSYCDTNCQVVFIPLGEQGTGAAHELGKNIWSALIESFPTIDNTINTTIRDDQSVKCEVLIFGRQEKDFAGILSKGKEFEEEHIFVFEVNHDGKISSIRVNWDHENFVRQLS